MIEVKDRTEESTSPTVTPAQAVADKPTDPAARRLFEAFAAAFGTRQWRLRLWDGAEVSDEAPATFTLTLSTRRGLDRLLGSLPERAFSRAFVSGDLDIEPLEPFLDALLKTTAWKLLRSWPAVAAASLALGARPDRARLEAVESRLRGRRHTPSRDAEAVKHHYDLPPEFYALWLDATMTYSCAYFERADVDLETAQRAKLDLVCRKLRLQGGERLLDIGSGWGSLVIHAAQNYGVRALGITLSPRQVEISRQRIEELGLSGRAEVRLADYRDDLGETFDAVASVGMFEHVGRHMDVYTKAIHRCLRPEGRVLAHGITTPSELLTTRGTFTDAFVFPDYRLHRVSRVVSSLEAAGLEVRDVESLREHYALTLHQWVDRLRRRRREAEELVGRERVRVWDLSMSGAELGFQRGTMGVHQILAVRMGSEGESALPLTRADWYAPRPQEPAEALA
jgi:cyclopropane-fatty-acyl-phospholipid synthase